MVKPVSNSNRTNKLLGQTPYFAIYIYTIDTCQGKGL